MLLFHKLLSLLTMVILVGCSHRLGGEKQELIESADSLYRAGEYSAAVTPAMQLLELAREDGDHYLCGQAEDLLHRESLCVWLSVSATSRMAQ